jgi:hypothetical protein
VFLDANIVGIGLGVAVPMPMSGLTLDIVPHRDVFVPFEMPVTELDPGWYSMRCDLEVDGMPRSYDGGRRFSVPWPRATVRRGVVKVDRTVAVGDARVAIEQLECGGDAVKLHLRVQPPGEVTVRLQADGDRLEVLETEFDEESGRAKVSAYPVMRSHDRLVIQLRGRGLGAEGTLEVSLAE